jgi:hypothetical protein
MCKLFSRNSRSNVMRLITRRALTLIRPQRIVSRSNLTPEEYPALRKRSIRHSIAVVRLLEPSNHPLVEP